MSAERDHQSAADIAAAIRDDGLRRLFQYWAEKRGTRRFPSRADVHPRDFPYVLGWVNLIDVERAPLRFRFRLHGTMLVQYTGCEMTGKYLDEHPRPEFREFLHRSWAAVVESGEPNHRIHDQVMDEHIQKYESLRLPFSSDGRLVDMLMVAARLRSGKPTPP